MADLDIAAALGADHIGGMLGFLIADIAAGDHRDKLGVLLAHRACQAVGHLDNVGAGGNDLAVFQRHNFALFDRLAVKFTVAGGVGDKTRAHLIGSRHHIDGVLLGGGVGVKVQHGGHTLRNGAGGQHNDLAVRQLLRLLGRHNDVLVVGQHQHGLGGYALDGSQNILGAGVHRLPAADNGIHAQVGKHALQTFARGHGDKAVLALGVNGGVDKLAVLLFLGLRLFFQTLCLLLAGKELLVHIFDFEVGQVAVLDRLAQHHTGVGGVYMAVGNIVVLDHDNGIAVGFQEGAQTLHAGIFVLVQQELGAVAVLDVLDLHQVVGKHALAGSLAGNLGLGGNLGTGNDALAVKHLLHTLKNDHNALTARVHDARLFQHGQQVGGIVQGSLTGGEGVFPHFGDVHPGAFGGALGSQPADGQDGTLGGFHNRLVGSLHTHFECGGKVGGIGGGLVLQGFGEAAEQQAGDNAGVAACAAQHSGGSGLTGFRHGAGVGQVFQLGTGGADGHAHIGAGVAVGNREYVQFIHAGALVGNIVGAGKDGVTQGLTSNHSLFTPHKSMISSTYTSMRATFSPVACSTSSLTRWVMLWVMVDIFSP